MVVGADIAELLMKERQGDNRRPSSVLSDISNELGETPSSEAVNSSSTSVVKEEVVTNKFREYLLHGSEKEALGMYKNGIYMGVTSSIVILYQLSPQDILFHTIFNGDLTKNVYIIHENIFLSVVLLQDHLQKVTCISNAERLFFK